MSGLDFIEDIRIAQFWRKQLGEIEYVTLYNPDDLKRWYVALETRGPQEIRDYLIERTGRHPMGEVTGIVALAPHPPRKIIDLWLDSYNKADTRPYWIAFAGFIILAYYTMTNLAGVQNLHSRTPLQLNPPIVGGPPPQVGQTPLPGVGSTQPANLPAPASVASPPTGSINGQRH